MSTPRIVTAAAMPAGTPAVPVAVVGAGACGLAAAIFLAEAGIECVLLERDARAQGSTALSSGFIPAAGTRVQRAAGVLEDDPGRFAADIQAKAKGRAAPHLVRACTEAIAPALDALEERHGLAFELLGGFVYPGHAVRRMHTLAERTGAALVAALEAAAVRSGATILTEALVRELWCEPAAAAPAAPAGAAAMPPRIVGLGFERPGGAVERLACAHLLLACNGFGGNAAMVRELLPAMQGAAFAGHAGNDGSAIAWGRQLGAALADLGGCQGHGSWAVPQGALITWALMTEGGIQVNTHGRRFHDETAGYSEASVEVLAQPGGIAWDVFDDRLLALGRSFPDFVAAEAAGAVRHAADTAALAALVGCDAATLARTLATAPRLAPPWHAIKVTGALFHTQGGLDIDDQCRVLHAASGRAFPNLLAAGGAARGVSGDAVWGYLSGNGLLSAIAGGFIAARTLGAAAAAPANPSHSCSTLPPPERSA
ncbi:MAG: FAD-dependent oxidoreductase [Rubrivivax sp.]|nr:FAD-dependent oxidoreductase [Rubrivivax sp.]